MTAERRHRLARPALADQPERLPDPDTEPDVLDDGQPPRGGRELDGEPLHREQRSPASVALLDRRQLGQPGSLTLNTLAPERVAQPVAHEVEGQDGQGDRDARAGSSATGSLVIRAVGAPAA